jgi:hypothetical protein
MAWCLDNKIILSKFSLKKELGAEVQFLFFPLNISKAKK